MKSTKDSKFYDNQNEIVVGEMKIVYRGIPINKFAELKSTIHQCFSMMVKNLIQQKD